MIVVPYIYYCLILYFVETLVSKRRAPFMNALLQEALMGTKHVSHAAIIKQKDGALIAKSYNFAVSYFDKALARRI